MKINNCYFTIEEWLTSIIFTLYNCGHADALRSKMILPPNGIKILPAVEIEELVEAVRSQKGIWEEKGSFVREEVFRWKEAARLADELIAEIEENYRDRLNTDRDSWGY